MKEPTPTEHRRFLACLAALVPLVLLSMAGYYWSWPRWVLWLAVVVGLGVLVRVAGRPKR